MRIQLRGHSAARLKRRAKIKARIRRKIVGTTQRPRISVFRSHKFLYVQCVNDETRSTLVGMSSRKRKELEGQKPVECAKKFGAIVGLELKQKGVQACVFDRSGYVYHGRIQAFADGLRESGIKI